MQTCGLACHSTGVEWGSAVSGRGSPAGRACIRRRSGAWSAAGENPGWRRSAVSLAAWACSPERYWTSRPKGEREQHRPGCAARGLRRALRVTIEGVDVRRVREARSRPLVQRSLCAPLRALSSALMLAALERARHPASSPSRQSRRGRDRCGGSESRRGLQPAGRCPRRGSECRKSLQAPGLSCDRARGRGRENIFEQINNTTSTVLYLHHDQQGSTRLLTGSTGKTEATFTYDAYGNLTGHTGTATTPLGYDGQYTSSDTGLIYLRARSYDPATAQFLSVDPKTETTGTIYGYSENDPLTNEDPTGECKQVNVAKAGSGELKHCGKDGRQLTVDFKTTSCDEGGCRLNYRATGVVAGAPHGTTIEQHFKIRAYNPAWSSEETIEEHKGVKNMTTPSYLGDNVYLPYGTTYTFELTIHEGKEVETLEVRLEAARVEAAI